MSEHQEEIKVQRILVALDASTHSLAALEAAAELAARRQAELIGLFVEDVNLVRLAGLPFAREVGGASATARPMSSDSVEQAMRLQAAQARRALAAAAERVHVSWSFRTVRGQVTASVLSAALEADLLAMGRVGWPLSRRTRLGSTARAAMAAAGSVLLLQQGRNLSQPVLVTYDGSPAGKQALLVAAQLAQVSEDDLNVLLLADSSSVELLKEEATTLLAEQEVTADFHWLPQMTVQKLIEMVRAREDCVLVLGGEGELLAAEAIQELLDGTDCPVMLVR
ncbi:MAG: universal stress protein [Chloroflexi bacterium]|nr:universal stress protein [Chloroflexota bacterium]MCI0577563.1 universal stress protein [Chloroflexota bacterium]MCI0646225.1 universal stress protein [Chloroflexota bacterium]MCI0732078.1 universal stress protein [Chloroflexota bacterium]